MSSACLAPGRCGPGCGRKGRCLGKRKAIRLHVDPAPPALTAASRRGRVGGGGVPGTPRAVLGPHPTSQSRCRAGACLSCGLGLGALLRRTQIARPQRGSSARRRAKGVVLQPTRSPAYPDPKPIERAPLCGANRTLTLGTWRGRLPESSGWPPPTRPRAQRCAASSDNCCGKGGCPVCRSEGAAACCDLQR